MARYGMVIDIAKCNGCFNCFLACRDEHCGNDFPPYSASQPQTGQSWMQVIEKERGKYPKVKVAYTPVPCMHCDDASCIKAATGAPSTSGPMGSLSLIPRNRRDRRRWSRPVPTG